MSSFKHFLLLTLVGLFLFSGPDAQAASKAPEIGTQGQSDAAQAQAMIELHKRLSASPRATVRHSVVLTADEADILTRPGVDSTGRFRVGVHRAVGKTVSNKGADLVVRIPGAPAVRLELTKVKGTVAVFNDAGEAHEYTEDGFTHTFSGDEVRVRGSAHVSGAGAVNMASSLCSENADCTENADCVSIPEAINDVRNAYASILYISGIYYYVCSGGLIADSDPETETPYFLTANHCVSSRREASSVETRFQYILTCGNGDMCGPLNLPDWGDTAGSTIIATDSSGDFTLLELAGDPPEGSVYLGWTSDDIAEAPGVSLYRISHPGGYPQAYSEHEVVTDSITCTVWPRGEWIYSIDKFGATEGGSSGSPVLNNQGQVVGQLSGACGFNPEIVCDLDNRTVDGAFAHYYPIVQQFLGDGSTTPSTTTPTTQPTTTTTSTTTTTLPPTTTTTSTTTTTTSTTTTTQPTTTCAYPDKGTCNADPDCEWIGHPRTGTCQEAVSCVSDEETEISCTDEIDNDCDGYTDCADSDCIGDPACEFTSCDEYLDRKTCQAGGCTWNNRTKMCEL